MKLEHSFTIPVPVEQAWPVLLDIQQIAPCMPGAAIESVDGDDFTGSVKVKLGPINLTYKGQAKFIEKDDATHKAVIDARGRDSRGNGTAAAKITAQLIGKGKETECSVVTDLNITGKPAQFGRGVMVDVGNKLIGQFADCLADKLGSDPSVATADKPAGSAGGSTAASAGATGTAGAAGAGAAGSAGTAGAAGAAGTASKAEPSAGAEDKTPTGSVKVSDINKAADKEAATAAKSAPAAARRPAAREAEPIDLLELAGGSVAKRAIPAAAGLAVLIAIIAAIVSGKKKN